MERSMAFFVLSTAFLPSIIQNTAWRALKKISEKNDLPGH
jgi:hypothetical protein